jgi:hypothetical protein
MIDPVTAVAFKTSISWLANKFKTSIIEKWSRRRAEAFFETFVERLSFIDACNGPLKEIEPLLLELLENEQNSEIMFEAYRTVCLSASASLGPRIIAVITARLIGEGRKALPEEERMLMVAESFGDQDLIDLADYLSTHALKNYEIDLGRDTEDLNYWGSSHTSRIGPMNLGEEVGNWCLKLANCGLVVQDIAKESLKYREDSEHHIDEPGTLPTYTWKLVFQSEVLELKKIIEQLKTSLS